MLPGSTARISALDGTPVAEANSDRALTILFGENASAVPSSTMKTVLVVVVTELALDWVELALALLGALTFFSHCRIILPVDSAELLDDADFAWKAASAVAIASLAAHQRESVAGVPS